MVLGTSNLEEKKSPPKAFGPDFPFHGSRYEEQPPPPQPSFRRDTSYLPPPVPLPILKNKIIQETPPPQIAIKLEPIHQPDTQVKQKHFASIPKPPQGRYNTGQLQQQTIKSEQLFQNQQPSRVHNAAPFLKPVGRKQVESDPISHQAQSCSSAKGM